MSPDPRFLGIDNFESGDFVNAIKARNGGISVITFNK